MRNFVRRANMSIRELEQELEQLKKDAFFLGKENTFLWQFRIAYLENYIKERVKQREELIPR